MERSRDAASGGLWRGWRGVRGLVATGAVLVGLLALVAAATHRSGGSGETRRGASPSTSFLSYAISTYLVVAVAMTALVVIFLFTHRESLEPRPAKRDLRSLVFLVVVVALVTLVASLRLTT